MAGHYDTAMFLLELGADLNAADNKAFTAVAHAEASDHFKLMDRLVMLGGKGHWMLAANTSS
jgi:ankyrin repeat protein